MPVVHHVNLGGITRSPRPAKAESASSGLVAHVARAADELERDAKTSPAQPHVVWLLAVFRIAVAATLPGVDGLADSSKEARRQSIRQLGAAQERPGLQLVLGQPERLR